MGISFIVRFLIMRPLIMRGMTVVLVALFLVASYSAQAAIYDDFAGTAVDQSKWQVRGDGFTLKGDGYLHFSGTGPASYNMTSVTLFKSGVISMSFSSYSCNNNAPPARGLGSIVGLGLGSRAAHNWVRIERGQIAADMKHGISGGYIEVNWVDPNEAGNPIHVNWYQSESNSGALQIRYDGTKVTFFFRQGRSTEWTQMMKTGRGGYPALVNGRPQPLVLTPGWTSAVPVFIDALPGGTTSDRYTLSFTAGPIDVGTVEETAGEGDSVTDKSDIREKTQGRDR